MLHNYHLFFSYLLRVTEKEKLAQELKKLSAAMLSTSEKQYNALKDTDWENAAKRNMGFFAVAGRLLDPQMPVPGQVKREVEAELKLIESRAPCSSFKRKLKKSLRASPPGRSCPGFPCPNNV